MGTSGALSWGAGGAPNGLARDLRPDELRGLTYTSPPLEAPVAVIGSPVAVLHLAASMPVATCVVRLSEVTPDGVSSLVATGVLNLTHRRSDTDPAPMPAGPAVGRGGPRSRLRVSGYRFTPGNRIRLTVLTSYWPVLWPSPFPGELRVHHGPALAVAPRAPGPARGRGDPARPAVPPRAGRACATSAADEEDAPEWRIEEDVLRGTVAVTIFDGGGSTQEDGSRLYSSERLVLTASDADPAHARLESDVVYRWSGFGADADIGARGTIASDEAAFDVTVALDVTLDGEPFFNREWRERIPRNLV